MLNVKAAEEQIYELKKTVRYDIRELTIEYIVDKYELSQDENFDENQPNTFNNTIFVPDYQRDFTWDDIRQSRFIESVLIGLPIPLIFVAETDNGLWEIVDGSQRVRTLHAFIKNKLILKGLDKLDKLNEFTFKDLESSRQRKFINLPIRIIVLDDDTDDEVKKDMFERINRGSDLLKPMEKRKGIYIGDFTDFIYECAKNPLFYKLAPIDKFLVKRQEREELLLRCFALYNNKTYQKYPSNLGITNFLDTFLDSQNKHLKTLSEQERQKYLADYKTKFEEMLDFVNTNFNFGFRISNHPQTKRTIFEAISIGSMIYLEKNKKVKMNEMQKNKLIKSMGESNDFMNAVTGNITHSPTKIKTRINFIVNKLHELNDK